MRSIARSPNFIWIDAGPGGARTPLTLGKTSIGLLEAAPQRWTLAFGRKAERAEGTMTALAIPQPRELAFLGVEASATGKRWRDRLDARGQAQAIAMAQRHAMP